MATTVYHAYKPDYLLYFLLVPLRRYFNHTRLLVLNISWCIK